MPTNEELRQQVIGFLKNLYPFRLLQVDREAAEVEELMGWIADSGEVIRVDAGETIYLPGDPAEFLYLILDGQLNMTRPVTKDTHHSYGVLEPGDMFGVEASAPKGHYLLEAYTVEECALFCLGQESLFALLDSYPTLALPLQMLIQSQELALRVDLPWRSPEETIHYIAQRHPVFLMLRLIFPLALFCACLVVLVLLALGNIPGTLLPGLLGGVGALLAGLWTIWKYIDWTNDYSIITSQSVVFQEKVILLYDSRLQAPLTAIQSNKINSTQMGRIIGYGDLVMKTYTGTIGFPDIRHPEVVVGILEDRFKRMMALHTEKELRELRMKIRERLGYVEPAQQKKKMEAPSNAPLPFRVWLGTIFRMRWESGASITYRKHWLILLSYIFLPSLFLGLLVLMTALTLLGVLKILGMTALLGLAVFGFLVVGFWWWYKYEDWANDIYVVSDDTVVDIYKKPLGFEEKRTAEVRNIQAVEYDQDNLAHLLFNFGDVRIRIGDTQFDFENVYNPSEVQGDLFRRIDRKRSAEKKKADDELHRHLVDLADAYHHVMAAPYEKEEGKKKSAP